MITIMSDLRCTEMGKIYPDGEEFLVIDRIPEDRSSGSTKVQFLSGKRQTFYWDHENPTVVFTGRGHLNNGIIRD